MDRHWREGATCGRARSCRGGTVGEHGPPGPWAAVGLEPVGPGRTGRGWRLSVGGPAISARSSVISPAVNSIAALDPTGNADAMRSRLRSSPIDHGNSCDRSSGDRTPLCADAVGPALDVNTTARPNGYTYPTSLSAMSPPSGISAVGRVRIPPMSTQIRELPGRWRRSEPCGRAVCRWPLSLCHCELSDDFRLRSLGTAAARGDLFSDPRIHFGLDPADGARA